ncbi:solid-state culture-specific protein-like protein [Penicillium hordei]|uniref:Solid-state culture-specific protein-like protein n=1 Tax=Penicillium hordei TaxID=40994 RepID=A0AAD6E9G4_9EURO|nr:solid-state culture-specific protein-like protein [Penicillium hordei]KAJ5604115.1 solid-state culture-specific protein-like protein [Penicillium hordei]
MNAPESVVLDYTLHDLYSTDNQDHDIWLLYAYAPPPHIQLAPDTPALTRFPVQSPLCPAVEKDELAQTLFHVTAQRFGFCSGPMPLLILEPGAHQDHASPISRGHEAISRVFGQLQANQRPLPTYTHDLANLALDRTAQLAVMVPLDWVAHLPHLIDPSTHYNLLSKRGLAESGLPTPRTAVIDTLHSPRRPWTAMEIRQEATRMTRSIREHPLPYVLKVPRVTSTGQGTFVVRTEADRTAVNTIFVDEVKSMLLALNPTNESLRPCNLILQEMVSGETVGLTFFVTKSGQVIFNSCTQQEVDETFCWSGGLISYHDQPRLERQYRNTMDAVGHFLHRSGYFGPAGVDVMTDESGTQLVVDLNVRITGTYHLGPLRGHFTRRGFFEAAALATHRLKCTRPAFERHFATDLRRGCVLVTAWVHAREASLATITVAAKDLTGLRELTQKLSDFAKRGPTVDDLGACLKDQFKL